MAPLLLLSAAADGYHWKTCGRSGRFPVSYTHLTYDYASMRDITIRPAASIKDNNTLFRVPARLDPDTEDLFYPASDLTDIYDITWRSDTRQRIIWMICCLVSPRQVMSYISVRSEAG